MTGVRNLSAGQTAELSLLVDLEACWENLRSEPPPTVERSSTLKELQHKQKAYEAFHVKLVAYNKDYRPAHVPELLLNTAERLGAWCRTMIHLHLAIPQDAQAHYPAHLLQKAYRWADKLSDKLKIEHIPRPPSARTTLAAIQELEDLANWCTSLIPTKLAS
jgi:hypothetical protein